MSEYWKSTPKYWCKHCSCYVRDTKLEKQNHEATGKHQGALKRFLRDLHRGHERQERDKERAQQEIARLNGIVSSSDSPASSALKPQKTYPVIRSSQPGEPQLKRQREQLAELGVAMPSDFRPEMAMPGEWTVTSTRVIDEDSFQKDQSKVEAKALGARKREETEDEREENEAIGALFKRPRRWGNDSKMIPQEEDEELDALLSKSVRPVSPNASSFKRGVPAGEIDEEGGTVDHHALNSKQGELNIKPEPADTPGSSLADIPSERVPGSPGRSPKIERDDGEGMAAAVVFKRRKPKGLRSK